MSISTGGKLANGGKKSGQIDTALAGTDGNDVADLQLATTQLSYNGGRGNDVIKGGTKAETLSGDDGNDWINGGGGNDTLNGGAGTDWLSFQLAAYVDGVTADLGNGTYTDGAFSVGTATGFENVWGSEGEDVLIGSVNANEIIGALGDDVISGLDGNDSLQGNDGVDDIAGGDGDDTVDGGDGSDTIEGGAGADTLTGGDGDDTFVFGADADTNGVDLIVDFQAAAEPDDAIVIDGVLASTADLALGDVLDLTAALSGLVSTAIGDYVKILDGDLLIDVDGAGTDVDFVKLADLQDVATGAAARVLVGSEEYSVSAGVTAPPPPPPPPTEPVPTEPAPTATDTGATEPAATEPAATEPTATEPTEPAAADAEPTPVETSDTGSGFDAPATGSFDTSSLDSGFVSYI